MVKKIFLVLLLISFSASAREWNKVKIPDAKCGDGADYFVFVSPKPGKKLLIELMSGGACWSADTCWGPNLRTWIHPIPKLPSFSVLTNDQISSNPVKDASAVYFPYCTGDIYAGTHMGKYLFGTLPTYHYGKKNIHLTMNYLKANKLINFDSIEDLTIFGASAGAIGSLLHADFFNSFTPHSKKRTLLSDSPGLHFGREFWDKFTYPLLNDFDETFREAGLNLDFKNGIITTELKNVFRLKEHWNIGILQGSQDIIMSTVFGDISPSEHEDLVLGPTGVVKVAKPFKNVDTWIDMSPMHTFLVLKQSMNMESEKSETALEFASRIHSGQINK